MMVRTSACVAMAYVVLGFVGLPTARADEKVSATGTWTWEFRRPNGGDAIKVTLKLKQDGEALTGTVSGPNNTEIEIKEGKVKDGEVSFEVTRERNGNKFTTKYHGALTADSIKGKSEREANGQTQSRDWEAKRS